jgi:hypothetical protein
MSLKDRITEKINALTEYQFIDHDAFFLILKDNSYLNREDFLKCFGSIKNLFEDMEEFNDSLLSSHENYVDFIFTSNNYEYVVSFYSY